MPLTRREILAGAAALGGPRAFARGYRPRLASQFYVWIQQFGREKKPLAQGVGEALGATRRAGFRRIELVSTLFTPETREATLAAIKEHGIEVPIVYQGGPMHETAAAEKTIAETVRLAELIKPAGARIINFNPNPKAHKTDEELATQARYAIQMGKELRQRGVQLILHHHNPEMADGAREWRHLLEHTDLPLCVDLHWVLRGGQDPMAILKEAGSRVASLHLRNSRAGVWLEDFGDGDIDHRAVAAWLRRTGYSGYLVIELAYEGRTAITRPLEENLRLSREYAQRVFGITA
jgi:sugar phosphate isomerase/epimerase